MIRLLKKLDYAKKNLPSGEPLNFSSLLGYRFPVFHDSPSGSYVDFYAFDPIAGKLQRKKIHLDKYKSKKERKQYANIVICTLTQKLMSGWNPSCDVFYASIDYRSFACSLKLCRAENERQKSSSALHVLNSEQAELPKSY